MMIRISVLSMMFALAVGAAGAQQLPPQPPPVASLMGQGNDQERAACHPDVSRFCQTQLQINPNDVLGILGCLQANRRKISRACQQVLGEPRSISRPKLGLGSGATDQCLFETASEETALGAAVGTR